MSYKHLSQEQRYQIQYYKSRGLSERKIATILGVSNSTISREVKRNSVTIRDSILERYHVKYEAPTANTKYLNRRAKNATKANEDILRIIREEFKLFNSITSIAGKWRMYIENFPSATTIYSWIRQGIVKPTNAYSKAFKLKRTKHKGQSQSHARDESTKTIHERPPIISNRRTFGHWELDLIESTGNGGYIISFIERLTRFTITKYIDRKTIANVNPFIRKVMKRYNVNSITTDNGNEFLQLHKLKKFSYQLEIYYCDPGAPYQKGQVEWFNKQMRRFIKKSDVFTAKSKRKIKHYTNIINNKYLRVLNYHVPSELEHYIKK